MLWYLILLYTTFNNNYQHIKEHIHVHMVKIHIVCYDCHLTTYCQILTTIVFPFSFDEDSNVKLVTLYSMIFASKLMCRENYTQ